MADYKIDAVLGNDGNDGTTNPWKTYAPANDPVNVIGAGDRVLFRRGQVHMPVGPATSSIPLKIRSNVVYDAFGEGPNPVLEGRDQLGHIGIEFGASEFSDTTADAIVRNLTVIRSNVGVFMKGTCTDNRIENLRISEVSEIGTANDDRGVGIRANCAGSNNSILYTTIQGTYGDGITITGSSLDWLIGWCSVVNVGIQSSGRTGPNPQYEVFGGVGGDGIALHSSNGGLIVGTRVDGNWAKGISLASTGYTRVTGCVVRNAQRLAINGPHCGGNAVVDNNLLVVDSINENNAGQILVDATPDQDTATLGAAMLRLYGNTFIMRGQPNQAGIYLGNFPEGTIPDTRVSQVFSSGNAFWSDNPMAFWYFHEARRLNDAQTGFDLQVPVWGWRNGFQGTDPRFWLEGAPVSLRKYQEVLRGPAEDTGGASLLGQQLPAEQGSYFGDLGLANPAQALDFDDVQVGASSPLVGLGQGVAQYLERDGYGLPRNLTAPTAGCVEYVADNGQRAKLLGGI